MRYLRQIKELNQVEQWKLERHPLDVRDAVLDRYAQEGPDAIKTVPGEVERLKWVGLYPQRQGGDAFMLRIKIPGGRLEADQARAIGEIADEFARGPAPNPVFGDAYLDITTRQDIQLHWVRIGAVPEIWRRLEAVGVTTVQACGDSARNVTCCPVSGLDAEEALDAYPVAAAISAWFTGNREYANLPRKFKLSVTGCREDCAQAEINDIGLWPARRDDGTVGYNVLVGGGLSDGPRMASDIDVLVGPDPDRVVELFRAIAQLFGELGNRENRGLARMRYLVQELGPERFRAELATRAGFGLEPAGEALTRRYRGDHLGVHAQRQPGLHYVGLNVTVGRMAGQSLVEAARLAGEYGDGGLRLATDLGFPAPVAGWTATRAAIRAAVEVHGYDPGRGVFTQAFDRPELDAALLLLPTVGFVAWDDPRMLRTVEEVRRELEVDGLLLRYRAPDGLEGTEGAFVACTFWLAEVLARQGRTAEARAAFASASATANDLGLFAEEFDVDTGHALGNFPQAFSHLALIEAAGRIILTERTQELQG